jgi:hypothetical protein
LVLLWRIGYAHEQGRRLLRIGCALLVGSHAVPAVRNRRCVGARLSRRLVGLPAEGCGQACQ